MRRRAGSFGRAWIFLAETPTLPMFLAGALILGSVALSQSRACRGA